MACLGAKIRSGNLTTTTHIAKQPAATSSHAKTYLSTTPFTALRPALFPYPTGKENVPINRTGN